MRQALPGRATPIDVRRVAPPAGGALRGLGESFTADEFRGAATFTVPLPASPARDLTPHLSLDYSSFAGNGIFGVGFDVTLAPVGRRTSHGVPRYDGSDVLVLDGDVLVPCGSRVRERGGTVYEVVTYRPRVESDYDRIEWWRSAADDFWWVTTTSSVATLYGTSGDGRVADPADGSRVFQWWPELSYDARGNTIRYVYKREDSASVGDPVYERGRVQTANVYPERICYGNVDPYAEGDDPAATAWLFEVVFDYGEYDLSPANDEPYRPVRAWAARPDAFSTYDAGFERRTHRLCRNVLLFHRFEEIAPVPVLVARTRLGYDEGPDVSCLAEIEQAGYRYHASAPSGERYRTAAAPPVRFTFTRFAAGGAWRLLRTTDGADVSGGYAGGDDAALPSAVDLYGDGLAGVLYAGGPTVRYVRPALDGTGGIGYVPEPPQPFPVERTGAGAVALADLDGNGRLDAVVTAAGYAGFHPNDGDGFRPFVAFESYPTAPGDGLDEFADLTNDGRPDIVLVEQAAVRYLPSLGARGYGPAVEAPRRAGLPLSAGPSGTELRAFARVAGVGADCRVRVRDGLVECWPSLGYGRFGAKVTLAGAPSFPAFDPGRVRFVDVDGSGTADLAYVFTDRVEVYRNLSGNAFAAEPVTIPLPAGTGHVSFADVDGTGTDSVLCAESRPPARQLAHGVLAPGRKPYLLTGIDNGLGAVTTIRYESSARYLLEDRRDGRPWVTTLPFPVAVVAEVEVADTVAQATSRTSLRYHDGYYDPVEREFRGFALVDRWDTDRTTAFAPPGGPDVVAPSLTRTWFLTGAWEPAERLADQCRRESFAGDPAAYPMPGNVFEWLAAAPSARAQREGWAALAGRPVRTEVYGLDGSERAANPYGVTAACYTVRELREPGSGHGGVFAVTDREAISYDYEREPADPRVTHRFALRFDAYGNPQRAATVSYGRRPGRPGAVAAQERTWLTFDVEDYVPPRDEPGAYLAGLPQRWRSYEIPDPPRPDGGYYSFAAVAAMVDAALGGGPPAASLLAAQRCDYATDPSGAVRPQALLLGTEHAAFGDAEIREVFAPTPLAAELTGLLRDDGGYRLDTDGYWWRPGEARSYYGAESFYAPAAVADPFAGGAAARRSGTTVTYRYDRYALAVVRMDETPSAPGALPMRVSVLDYDYQTLTARKVRDANGVVSEVLQDPLGRVVVTSHGGDEWHAGVVVRTGFAELDPAAGWPEPASPADVIADPRRYLRGAATFTCYDLGAPARGAGPASVTTLTATEYPDPARPDEPRGQLGISVSYGDGAGRPVQETVRVEPGPGIVCDAAGRPVRRPDGTAEDAELAERWRVSGRVRFNGKGEPFRRYEPFFAGTWQFVTDEWLAEFGVSPTLRYDAVGRAIRVDHPRGQFADAFFDRVEIGAWEQTVWDTDDTVLDSRYYRYHVDEGHPLPARERDALLQAAALAGTPATTRLDALGHPIQDVARLGGPAGSELLVTTREFLVTGEERWAADPRLGEQGLRNLATTYGLGGVPLKLVSADAGDSYRLADVTGNVIASVDPRGIVVSATYDSRQRVTAVTVREPGADPRTTRRFVYGDSLDAAGEPVVDPAARNVLGRLVVSYDEAGRAAVGSYTLGGQPLDGEQRLVASYDEPGDWSGTAPTWAALFALLDGRLDAEAFATAYGYDALGRPTTQTDPAGNRWFETYDVSGLPATAGIEPPGGARRTYVGEVAYNARGDRERVRLDAPDGTPLTTTTYSYDPWDFRLTGLRTVRGTDGAVLQDLAYWYDPVGNPTSVTDTAAPVQRLVRAQQVVTPDRGFRYDSLYRLVGATGRAHTAYSRADLRTASYAPYFSPAGHPNDPAALENYTTTYTYDAGDNLVRLAYAAPSSQWAQALTVAATSNRAVEDPAGRPPAAGAFDAAGNPSYLDGLPSLGWDYRGALREAVLVVRPDGVDDAVLASYRASGERARKVVRTVAAGGVHTDVTVYLGPFEIHREIRGGEVVSEYHRLRVMDDDRCAVQVLRWTAGAPPGGGETEQHRYQLDDRLGSSVMELDAAGRLVSYEEYAPYGGTTYASGVTLAEVSRKHYRFSGKERDPDTGLQYFGGRHYAPWLGRWISPDPAGPVDGLNLYEYARSSPTGYVDPSGLISSKKSKSKPDPKRTAARADARKLFGPGRAGFYPGLKAVALKSRSGNVAARKQARELAKRMRNDTYFREEIAKRVRVRAVKAGGAKKGYGKDEVFQTSETAYAFEVSAGLVPGVTPVAYFKGASGAVQEVDLLDAQEHVRFDTSIVPTKEGGGHTGMLRASASATGYMTVGQAQLHQERTDVMKAAPTTGEAILNTMARHIHATANVATMQAKHTQYFTVTNQDLSKPAHQTAFVTQMARVRDQAKLTVEAMRTRFFEDPAATTQVAYTEAPLSPRHSPTYAPAGLTAALGLDQFGSFVTKALPTFASTK